MKELVVLLFVSLILSACVSNSSTSQGEYSKISNSKINATNPKKALEKVLDQGGINVEVALGQAGNKKSSGYQTGFFNMTSAYDTVEQPYKVTVALNDSLASQQLRETGKPIYIYIRPEIAYTMLFNKDKRTDKQLQTVNFPEHSSSCDGFEMILNQQNNYLVKVEGSQTVTFRNKSSGVDFGLWGTHGGSDWVVTGAEGAGSLVVADLEQFYVGTKNAYGTLQALDKPRGNLKPHFIRRETVCIYGPHSELLR